MLLKRKPPYFHKVAERIPKKLCEINKNIFLNITQIHEFFIFNKKNSNFQYFLKLQNIIQIQKFDHNFLFEKWKKKILNEAIRKKIEELRHAHVR